MSRLTLKKNRLGLLKQKARVKYVQPKRLERIMGDTLQKLRFKFWKASPYCANCGRLVDWPDGFHLDHILPLSQGGGNEETNLQILCSWHDENGVWRGCHAEKTEKEKQGSC